MSSTELVFRVLVSRRHAVPRDSTTLAYRVECYNSTHSLLYRVVILLEEKLRASATLHLSGTVFQKHHYIVAYAGLRVKIILHVLLCGP